VTGVLSRAWGEPPGAARIRERHQDFLVEELLGFEPDGEGEHAFLHLEKRGRNTQELARELARLAGVPERDVGFSGLKDRNAVTRQWFSVGLAGRPEPDWDVLAARDDVAVLTATRHRRKLRRGVHRRNRFTLMLRGWSGDYEAQQRRLKQVQLGGVPNYFGEQRFGRDGQTLRGALEWVRRDRKLRRTQRTLFLSALRGHVFNVLLAERLSNGNWLRLEIGDIAMLAGTRSLFRVEDDAAELQSRIEVGDLHPGLPLPGRGILEEGNVSLPGELVPIVEHLVTQGLDLDWRAARVIPDDFSWEFCDHETLRLTFSLPAGSYATAVLAECVQYRQEQ